MVETFETPPPTPYTILEIGVGRVDDVTEKGHREFDPGQGQEALVWSSTADHRKFASHEQFIGIDLGAKTSNRILPFRDVQRYDHKMFENWRTVQSERPDERLHFLQADATKLPLMDTSVDEVVMNNMFGTATSKYALVGIYREAQRVLKETGKLIIHDDQTPHYIGATSLLPWFYEHRLPVPDIEWINAETSPEAYAKRCKRYGFNINKYAALNDDKFRRKLNAERTLWILDKAPVKQPEPRKITEQSPDANPPSHTKRLPWLTALLRKISPQ